MGQVFIPQERSTSGEKVCAGHVTINGVSACGFDIKDDNGNADVNFNIHPKFHGDAARIMNAVVDSIDLYGMAFLIAVAPGVMGSRRVYGDMVVSVSVDNMHKAVVIVAALRDRVLRALAGQHGTMSDLHNSGDAVTEVVIGEEKN